MLRAMESFNKYGVVADLNRTALHKDIVWYVPSTTITGSLLGFSNSPPGGIGQCLILGGGQVNGNYATLVGTLPESRSSWIVQFGVNFNYPGKSSVSGEVHLTLTDLTAGTAHVGIKAAELVISQAAKNFAIYDASGTLVHSVANTADLSKPFFVAIQVTSGTEESGNGVVILWLNGQQIYQGLNLNTQGGSNATYNGFSFSVPSNGGTLQGGSLLADLSVLDTQPGPGVIPTNTSTGPAYVTPSSPVNNGTRLDWIPPGATVNYENVNAPQSNNGSTSNLGTQSALNSTIDLYTMAEIQPEFTKCLGVKLSAEFSNTSTSIAALVGCDMLSNGIDRNINVGTLASGSASYVYAAGISGFNPNTGDLWNVPDVNAAQAGPSLQPNLYNIGTIGGSLATSSGTLVGTDGVSGTLSTPANGIEFSMSGTIVFGTLLGGPIPLGLGFEIDPTSGGHTMYIHLGAGDDVNPQIGQVAAAGINPILIAGDPNFVIPTDDFVAGGTVTVGFSGFAIVTNVIGTPGNYQAHGIVVYYLDLGAGPELIAAYDDALICPSSGPLISDATNIVTWGLGGESGGFPAPEWIYSLDINNATIAPPAEVDCTQFQTEVMQFTSSYGAPSDMTVPAFPALIGLDFPIKTPMLNNGIGQGAGGAEVRVGYYPYPLWQWVFDMEYLPDAERNGTTSNDYQTLVGFFLSRYGSLLPFTYKDPNDYMVTEQEIAIADGSTQSFTIYRTFGNADGTGTEPVGVVDTSQPIEVYLNDTLQSESSYTINTSTPLNQQIVFVGTPSEGDIVKWTGQYSFYCRFKDMQQDFTQTGDVFWETEKLTIVSLRQA